MQWRTNNTLRVAIVTHYFGWMVTEIEFNII